MATSEKTPNLSLSKWQGGDRPKREDFVSDNMILDAAITALREQVSNGGGSGSGGGSTQDPRLDAHLANSAVHMSTAEKQSLAAADTHRADNGVHMSAADRQALDAFVSAVPVVGTYTGDGSVYQSVILGFRPKYGFVFADGKSFLFPQAVGTNLTVYAAMFAENGGSEGVEVISTGFRGRQLTSGSQSGDTHVSLNKSGQKYIYVVWR